MPAKDYASFENLVSSAIARIECFDTTAYNDPSCGVILREWESIEIT